MRLIRDLLDAQLVDGNGAPLGKVDGVLLELRDRGRPRVAAIQVGAPVLANRLRWPLRSIVCWIANRWNAKVMTLPWESVKDVGVDIEVHLDGRQPESRDWERWLVKHIVEKIPGA